MNIPRVRSTLFAILFAAIPAIGSAQGSAQSKSDDTAHFNKRYTPDSLPGHGLREHDFLISGVESSRDKKGLQIVKGGEVAWNYYDPTLKGAFTDASLLPDGNVLIAHSSGGARLVSPDKKVLWKHEVAAGEHEIHGIQPIGTDRVVFLQNGNPTARIIVANVKTGKIEKEVEVPLAATANMNEPRYVHMQARRLRLTPQGTALIAYTNANKVAEYDENGKEVWSASVPGPWSVERLPNGNTLVNSMRLDAVELNRQGETVWSFSRADAAKQGYIVEKTQSAMRLPNGNTLITVNMEPAWRPGMSPDAWAPVQAIEVSPEKKIVWALRDWRKLGAASTMQTLDDPRIGTKLHFGSFR